MGRAAQAAEKHGFIVHPDDWNRISRGVDPAVLGRALIRAFNDAFGKESHDTSDEIKDFAERMIYGILWDHNRRDHKKYKKSVKDYIKRSGKTDLSMATPSMKDVAEAAQAMSIPEDYAVKFHERLSGQDWVYNTKTGARKVTRKNLKATLGAFWSVSKANAERPNASDYNQPGYANNIKMA